MSYSTIKFGDNLTKNKLCTITYSGMLFQNNSESVNIVYGFGNEWHHTKEQEMEKTEDGFVVDVNMLEYDTFNFCFRNSNYEWDNNNNQNYTSPITEEVPEEINFILNDDSVIDTIINTLCEIDVSTADNTPIQSIETPTHFENIVENIETSSEIVTEEPSTVENIVEIEPIVTEESVPFEIEVETNTPVNIEETLVNITEAETLDQDIETLFNDIYQEAGTITIEENSQNETSSFNMNSLIDEILSPVVQSTIIEEETDLDYSNQEPISSNLFEDFDDTDEDSTLDNKIDSLITDLFNNTKAFAESQKFLNFNLDEAEITKAIDEKIEEILAETPVITEENVYAEKEIVNFEETESNQIIEEIKTQEAQEITVEAPKKKVPDFTIISEDEEESIIETLNNKETNNQTALIELDDATDFIVSTRGLRKFYMFKKKVKLAFTKLFVTLPKLFAKGFNAENN